MAKKPFNWWLWSKMLIGWVWTSSFSHQHDPLADKNTSGGAICVGGPAFVRWVQPTDEELFQRYSPELKKRSLEGRIERQQEFDDFVVKLKEYSKSDKPSTGSTLKVTCTRG